MRGLASPISRREPVECIECPRCARIVVLQADYFCPACGAHNDELYRAEHAIPGYAATMSRYQIEREYERAGVPFRHDPNKEVGASGILQSELMKIIRARPEEESTTL